MGENVEMEVSEFLRFFVDTRQYSIVDRIAYALSIDAAIAALYDAIRSVRALRDAAVQALYKRKNEDGNEVEVSVLCCYWEECSEKTQSNEKCCKVGFFAVNKETGKGGCCVVCPSIPTEEQISEFIKLVKSDIAALQRVGAIAMGYRTKRSQIGGA